MITLRPALFSVLVTFIAYAAVCPQGDASQMQAGSPPVHGGEASHYGHCTVSTHLGSQAQMQDFRLEFVCCS